MTETNLSVNDLVMPYFLKEENDKAIIKNMPGLGKRFSTNELIKELKEIEDFGIKTIAIFPKVNEKKDNFGSESLNEDNLVCRSLREIKKKCPNISVICDFSIRCLYHRRS